MIRYTAVEPYSALCQRASSSVGSSREYNLLEKLFGLGLGYACGTTVLYSSCTGIHVLIERHNKDTRTCPKLSQVGLVRQIRKVERGQQVDDIGAFADLLV